MIRTRRHLTPGQAGGTIVTLDGDALSLNLIPLLRAGARNAFYMNHLDWAVTKIQNRLQYCGNIQKWETWSDLVPHRIRDVVPVHALHPPQVLIRLHFVKLQIVEGYRRKVHYKLNSNLQILGTQMLPCAIRFHRLINLPEDEWPNVEPNAKCVTEKFNSQSKIGRAHV